MPLHFKGLRAEAFRERLTVDNGKSTTYKVKNIDLYRALS